MKAIIGKKVGMSQIFDENGKVIPVTVIAVSYTHLEEEVQGQEVCRRVLPGCDPAGGRPPGLDPGGADGKDHPGHAQLRGFRKRRHGDPVIQAQPPEIRRLCSFLLTFSFWADTIMF